MMTPYFTVVKSVPANGWKESVELLGNGKAVIAPFAVTATIAPQALAL